MKLIETTETNIAQKIEFCCEKATRSGVICVSSGGVDFVEGGKDGKISLYDVHTIFRWRYHPINFCPFCGTKVNNNVENVKN